MRGITLEEVADYTKVSLRYLKAIEDDDLKALPAATFVRGFLKSYAKFIGLNPEEVVFNFDRFESLLSKETPSSFTQPPPSSKKGTKFFYVFMAAMIPLLMLVLGYAFHARSKGPFPSLFNFARQAVADKGSGETGSAPDKPKAPDNAQIPATPPLFDFMLGSPLDAKGPSQRPNPSTLPYQIQLPEKTEIRLKEDSLLVRPHDQLPLQRGALLVDVFQMNAPPSSQEKKGPDHPMQHPEVPQAPAQVASQEKKGPDHPIQANSEENRNQKATLNPPLQTTEKSVSALPAPQVEGNASSPISPEKPLGTENKGHTLEITCIDRAWLRVYVDNERVFEGILEPSTVKVWRAKEKFMVSTGNAGGIELKLDNQKLPSLGKKGEVVTGVTLPKGTSLSGAGKGKPSSSVLE